MKIRKLRVRLRNRKQRRDRQVRLWKKTHERGHAKAAHKEAKAVRYLRRLVRQARRHAEKRQQGLDWAWGRIGGASLRAGGKRFACRYFSHDSTKNLTRVEALELASHGVSLIGVWESTGARAKDGYEAGREDAQEARRMARECGKPAHAPIFFAIDFDAAGPEVEAYFRGVNSVLGAASGAYGGFKAIAFLFARKLIKFGWQTYAWSDGRWHPNAHLRQYSNDHTFAGVGVDYDVSTRAYFGQWRPKLKK